MKIDGFSGQFSQRRKYIWFDSNDANRVVLICSLPEHCICNYDIDTSITRVDALNTFIRCSIFVFKIQTIVS